MTFRLSPGIYAFEEYRPQVVSSEIQSIIGVVGVFAKGSLSPRRTSTRDDLLARYTTGTINREFGFSTYSAFNALESARHLVIKRVVNDALHAGASVVKSTSTHTELVPFLVGAKNGYELGGRDLQSISVSGPLPSGCGLSCTMKNSLTNESVSIINAYSSTASSNEMLSAFAALVQQQLDFWGTNGKAQVNKAWTGAPRQQIQTISFNRAMISGESVSIVLTDVFDGVKTVDVAYATSMSDTLAAIRAALNATGFVFSYIDTTADNQLVVMAINAGPARVAITSTLVNVAEDELKLTVTQTQAGKGIYDDTLIALSEPDSVPVEYNDIAVVLLQLDDAALYTLVSLAIAATKILPTDRDAVMTELTNVAPIMSEAQANAVIDTWAEQNPYMRDVTIVSDGDVAAPVVGDVLSFTILDSNNESASVAGAVVKWARASSPEVVIGTGASYTLQEDDMGEYLVLTVTAYRVTQQKQTAVVEV